MLLPSALPCSTRPQQTYHHQHLLPSLLPSPFLSQTSFSNDSNVLTSGIINTCRTLHNLLNIPAVQTHHNTATPTTTKINSGAKLSEPTSSARAYHEEIRRGLKNMVIKKRLMRPTTGDEAEGLARSREQQAEKTVAFPPRDTKKRGWDDSNEESATAISGFSTPKRRRYGPVDLPLGLERADFCALQDTETTDLVGEENAEENGRYTSGSDQWDSEEDRLLVNLVLEKFKLSRKQWDECAKVLGREGTSLGRRWRYLLGEGEVGIKFRKGRKERKSLRGVWFPVALENRVE